MKGVPAPLRKTQSSCARPLPESYLNQKPPPFKNGHPRLTPEQKKELVARIHKGEKQGSLATEYQISQSGVSYILKRSKEVAKSRKVIIDPPTDWKRGTTNLSPSLQRIKTSGTSEHALLKLHQKRYLDRISFIADYIQLIETHLTVINNNLVDDFAKDHGMMLARWAAYEKIWKDDLDEIAPGFSTFEGVRRTISARLGRLSKELDQKLSILDNIKHTKITIQD